MPEANSKLRTDRWTIGSIATTFGMDWRTVRNKIKDANIEPVGTDRGNAVYSISAVAKAVFAHAVITPTSSDFNPESFPPKERKEWYEGEKIRIALEEKSGQLVSLDEFRSEMARVLKEIAAALETLPDVIDRKCHLPPAAIDQMQKILDEQRDTIADRIEAATDNQQSD
jgi:hypothetical protein